MPGTINLTPGGVCRNIAHDISLILSHSVPLLLITVVADDANGRALAHHCKQTLGAHSARGIHIVCSSHTRTRTPSVSIILNSSGDVAACVADVDLLETALTPELVAEHHSEDIRTSFCVVVDGDLSQDVIERVCQMAHVSTSSHHHTRSPIVWFEPVSAPKAVRAARVLNCIDYISPNASELLAMASSLGWRPSGAPEVHCARSILPGCLHSSLVSAIEWVLIKGRVKNIVLTLGGDGAAWCRCSGGGSGGNGYGNTEERKEIVIEYAPALPARVVNCSGAGDCLVAGFIAALQVKESPLAWGVAMAKRAVESELNVPRGSMAVEAIRRDAGQVQRTIQSFTICTQLL